MKRRTFISTLAALVTTPALPAATALSVPSVHISQHFTKAKLLARCHDRASPEMFARLMQLDKETAEGLFNLLRERSVITQGIDGVMRATNPLNTHCVPNEAIRARDFAKITQDLKTRLQDMAKRRFEHEEVQNAPLEDALPEANSLPQDDGAPASAKPDRTV